MSPATLVRLPGEATLRRGTCAADGGAACLPAQPRRKPHCRRWSRLAPCTAEKEAALPTVEPLVALHS